jgi:hypothetical protein
MARIEKLREDLAKLLAGAEDAISDDVAFSVGYTVRLHILNFVSKGISPILGAGRFPEYKASKGIRAIKSDSKTIRSLLKNKSSGNRAQLIRKQSQLKRRLDKQKKAYPFSVQKEFPGKKPRPVNLLLSGDFLRSLDFNTVTNGKVRSVVMVFFDKLSIKKESGHRKGVNGQPKRPIIPAKNSESWNETITRDIFKILKQAIDRYFKGI